MRQGWTPRWACRTFGHCSVMTNLNCKLDWFSFTFPITLLGVSDNEYTLSHILSAFHEHTRQRLLPAITQSLWTWVQSGGFYDHKIQCPKSLITISWKAGNPYALCEISGTSVDRVLQSVTVADLASSANQRATRIDLATDIETEESPEAFATLRNKRSFRAHAFYKTETGETYYVGSRTSDRMARIYRFYPPHPRSHLLRVEIETKGDLAKNACASLIKASLTETTLSVNLPYGWAHPIWDTNSADVSKIPARAYDKDGANTLRWLSHTVAPAIKKAHDKGLIDLRLWLNDHFDIEIPE